MDQDWVRLYLVLEDNSWTWSPPTERWRARDACRDFVEGTLWDQKRVLRALIVDTGVPV